MKKFERVLAFCSILLGVAATLENAQQGYWIWSPIIQACLGVTLWFLPATNGVWKVGLRRGSMYSLLLLFLLNLKFLGIPYV